MRTGIIGAMAVEVELLKERLANAEVTRVAGMEFSAGTLDGADVVVVQSGIGKVNAGVCAQVLAGRFGVDAIINTGVAGSLDARLDIGDLVVSVDCMHHDFDLTPLGYRPGEVPGLGAVCFAADPSLRAAALLAASEVAPEVAAVEGRVVSGDQFITDPADKDRLAGGFGGTCCEMEGAAIAQVALLNNIPYVVVRAISDKPGHEGQVTDYAAFEAASAHRCAQIVARMVAA